MGRVQRAEQVPPRLRAGRLLTALVLVAGASPVAAAEEAGVPVPPSVLQAGAYSFSDELGGFRLLSANGLGTREKPITLIEEFDSASPATLVIRIIRPIRTLDSSGLYANGFTHMHIEVINNSNLPWIEFEFELQERLGEPSVFGDGLSFDQRQSDTATVVSDRFLSFSRDFEPYDRLLFRHGTVDQRQSVSFDFLITDFTPRWQFFLVMDPRIPAS